MHIENLHPLYIADESGKRISVILPIAEFEKLLEDLEDLAILAKRKNEPTVTYTELMAELKRDRLL